jgi:guanine nucleotide-binding protein subunit alpha
MCFGGREDVEAKRSKEIDQLIHRDEKFMQKVVKLLLLGTYRGREFQRQYPNVYG